MSSCNNKISVESLDGWNSSPLAHRDTINTPLGHKLCSATKLFHITKVGHEDEENLSILLCYLKEGDTHRLIIKCMGDTHYSSTFGCSRTQKQNLRGQSLHSSGITLHKQLDKNLCSCVNNFDFPIHHVGYVCIEPSDSANIDMSDKSQFIEA